MFLLRRKRRSIMSQDELVIGIVVLVACGLATVAIVLGWNLHAELGGDGMLYTSRRSLLVVLDEELLINLALWWWVVFVLWATRPNYDWEAWQDPHKVGWGKDGSWQSNTMDGTLPRNCCRTSAQTLQSISSLLSMLVSVKSGTWWGSLP
jgi:hypothetical protein